MIRLFHLVLFSGFCCLLQGQDPVLRTAESLRNNVVRLSVSFPGGSKQEGFGFITGEKNGQLYLATAAHVVHGEEFNQKPSLIQVRFYTELKVYTAEVVTFFEQQDLALIQMTKPLALDYKNINWADFAPQNYQAVRFVGRGGEWLIPGQGEVYKIDNDRIVASMTTVRLGTSGAPLINANGIIGLIIEDDNQEVTAVALSKIRDLFGQGGRFPYFNSVSERPIDNPVLTTPPAENDLSTYNLVKIEGGKYRMGCIETRDGTCSEDEQPEHEVSISAFHLGKYEVTNAEFVQFLNAISAQISIDANGDGVNYQSKKIFELFCGDKKGDCKDYQERIEYYNTFYEGEERFRVLKGFEKHPVVMVSKYGAEAYCAWLNSKTGKTYRLPTEAEWEFAARGGIQSQRYKYAGSNDLDAVGWYSSNSSSAAHTVGLKNANELGLYDMSGNVWEWCSDWYASDYYKNSPVSNPKGPDSGTRAVLRGGSWSLNVNSCRLADRYNGDFPGFSYVYIGFRVARNL